VYFDRVYSACELFVCQVKKARKGLEDWKAIKIPRVGKIERVVASFEVWAIGVFPSAKVKIKILESPTGYYTGFPNMAAKSQQDRSPDWIAGGGESIPDALEDTIKNLLQSITENGATSEEDFEWSAPEDF
jgi:hypothetical protein